MQISNGIGLLDDVVKRVANIKENIGKLSQFTDPQVRERTAKLSEKIDGFSAKITLVGQVKAGKTELTNALIGQPGLLPSDVNPWTSVVTTVHMNEHAENANGAVFKFFTADDWSKLVVDGGRLGEMARRTNSDSEMRDLTAQLENMRETTQRRLGANFKMLLGNSHKYNDYTPELIERYVCLGEDDDPEKITKQGRYADLTKSAELFVKTNPYELPMSFRDTPGVNDPFLVREQVTLNSLEDTDVCVVVLSAHQALTTMDLALLRVLMALKQEQIILFVNRIDELPDPAAVMPDIEKHIRETLKKGKMPSDIEIVFGSALWANAAVADTIHELPEDSLTVLQKLAGEGADVVNDPDYTYRLSNIPGLQRAIAERVSSGPAKALVSDTQKELISITQQALAVLSQSAAAANNGPMKHVDENDFADQLDAIVRDHLMQSDVLVDSSRDLLHRNLASACSAFIDREAKTLTSYLSTGGNIGSWTADSNMLRRDLKSAYQEFTYKFSDVMSETLGNLAKELQGCYDGLLADGSQKVEVEAPAIPDPSAPAVLARTLAVDMGGPWWKKWMIGKRGPAHYEQQFRRVAKEEIAQMMKDLEDDNAVSVFNQARTSILDFVLDHCVTLLEIASLGKGDESELKQRLDLKSNIGATVAKLEEMLGDFRRGTSVADAHNNVIGLDQISGRKLRAATS